MASRIRPFFRGLLASPLRGERANIWVFVAALLLMLGLMLRFVAKGALWDDHFIFDDEVIQRGLSPWLYWTRGHPQTRTWPLFFTVLWFLKLASGSSLTLFHAANILLHAVNGWLILRAGRLLGFRWPAVPAAIFLIHPIVIEPVAWVFQISKLMSLTFLLTWFLLAKEQGWRARLARLACLFGALTVGGYGYVVAAAECVRVLRARSLAGVAVGAVLLGVALYTVFLASAGIGLLGARGEALASYEAQLGLCRLGSPRVIAPPSPNESVARGAWYLLDATGLSADSIREVACLWTMKFAAVGLTASAYALRIFLPLPQRIPAALYQLPPALVLVLAILGFGIVASALFLPSKGALSLLVLTFLPVSGLAYFPWMKLSLVDDRLFYVPLAFLLLAVWRFFDSRLSKRSAQAALLAFVVFLAWQAGLRASYMTRLFAMPFNCVICAPPP